MIPPTKAEKLKIFLDERRRTRQPPEPVSLRDLARVDEVLGAQGRFAEQARVTGSDPAASYPALPEGSPWSRQEPPEPTINAEEMFFVEPVGTHEEIERSLIASEPSECAQQGVKAEGVSHPPEAALPLGSDPLTPARSAPNIKIRRIER